MKEKKTKSNKENWIGNIIRGFLLFMPLLAIGVTCAYAIFNKNAYQSYENYQTQSIVNVSQNDTLQQGRTYTITYTTGLTQGQTFYIDNGQTNIVELFFPNENWIAQSIFPSFEGTRTRLIIYDTNNNQHNKFNWQDISNNFWFVSTGVNTTNPNNNYAYQITTLETTQAKLDNVFYYSIDKVQQSPLFNWATDTGMYNVIHGACTTLGIETTFVPFLLAYWLLTYLIYIIYDIALLIVNMAHNRIHDVESSI